MYCWLVWAVQILISWTIDLSISPYPSTTRLVTRFPDNAYHRRCRAVLPFLSTLSQTFWSLPVILLNERMYSVSFWSSITDTSSETPSRDASVTRLGGLSFSTTKWMYYPLWTQILPASALLSFRWSRTRLLSLTVCSSSFQKRIYRTFGTGQALSGLNSFSKSKLYSWRHLPQVINYSLCKILTTVKNVHQILLQLSSLKLNCRGS